MAEQAAPMMMTFSTGADFYALRLACGMTVVDFGRALGYRGNRSTIKRDISRIEHFDELPPEVVERIAAVFKAAAVRNSSQEVRP